MQTTTTGDKAREVRQTMQRLEYSAAGLAMTKAFEGLRLTAYQDVAGVWTVGYGHTGPGVQAGLVITDAKAEALLLDDLGDFAGFVRRAVRVEITQGQFDALVDFCFNLGRQALLRSALLRKLNGGDFDGAAEQFALWVHAGGKVQAGLVRRRKAEAEMFLGNRSLIRRRASLSRLECHT